MLTNFDIYILLVYLLTLLSNQKTRHNNYFQLNFFLSVYDLHFNILFVMNIALSWIEKNYLPFPIFLVIIEHVLGQKQIG